MVEGLDLQMYIVFYTRKLLYLKMKSDVVCKNKWSACGCILYFFYLATQTPPYYEKSLQSSYATGKYDQCCYYSSGYTDWQDIQVIKVEQVDGVTDCMTGYSRADDSTLCRSVGTFKCAGYVEDCDPNLSGEDYCCRCKDIGPGQWPSR